MFEKFHPAKLDPILSLSKLFQSDQRNKKIDLGIGVYKNDSGVTPVMSSVKKAEARLLTEQSSKAYVSLAGAELFRDQMRNLVLGDSVVPQRVATLQTPGGTGAIRQILEAMDLATDEPAHNRTRIFQPKSCITDCMPSPSAAARTRA